MKLFINNRKGQKISVLIDKQESQKGLVFVMHGLGGFKEQPHIQTFADSFLESGFTVVRFDTTDSFGESDGNYENATTTNYYEDLEDVINWANKQEWYQEPFCLIGHSLGGLCITVYASRYQQKVQALVPASPTINAEILENKKKGELTEIDGIVWHIVKHHNLDYIKKLKWINFIEDFRNYDLRESLAQVNTSKMVLIGENESYLKPLTEMSRELGFNLEVIKNADHNYLNEGNLKQIKEIIKKFISGFL